MIYGIQLHLFGNSMEVMAAFLRRSPLLPKNIIIEYSLEIRKDSIVFEQTL